MFSSCGAEEDEVWVSETITPHWRRNGTTAPASTSVVADALNWTLPAMISIIVCA